MKPSRSENYTNFKAEANLKQIWFPILQGRIGRMLSSVFQNANTHLSKIYLSNISESQSINHCQANIPILSPCCIPYIASI